MAKTDQVQGPLQDAFEALDGLRGTLKIIDAGFALTVGDMTASMAPPQVQALKAKYQAQVAQLKTAVAQFPDAHAFFP
jgi:hypothetical protein